eukprot:CAMPEP_0197023188 /NCGR_PEP_ID=MMETSP1384-20130603/3970_1 /TAXON_ID=29189 /ORGANISM="Ammonia sp." /LENGTH=980 /DNA_ID=CAMNT_0042451377 /DNA_START=12 /DNA_END=2954 /DNA_ORIENTATION=-
MSSFPILFSSYKNILSQKKLHDVSHVESAITASDIQTATKKIFSIASQQNAATLNSLSFYETLSSHFLQVNDDQEDDKKVPATPTSAYTQHAVQCTPLLKEIGWDLLTELFLLYSKDERFSNFLVSISNDISPRELSIMFAEAFSHPVLSINATHHYFQLHIMQNHYVFNDEDTEQRKQMMNLNLVNKPMSMDASDDILSFHKNLNYLKIQTLFIKCIIIMFKRLTQKTSSKYAINHFYQSLLPTAIVHFQTLSKELSYQFYLANMTQYHDHHGHGHTINDCVSALDVTKKQRQEWLANSKREYEAYLQEIYKLFALMVNNHLDLKDIDKDTEIKDAPVDIEEMIKCFQPRSTADGDAMVDYGNEDQDDDEQEKEHKLKQSNNLNTLWLARYGFGVLSGVYWWYNVVYNEDMEDDGDVNNDSTDVLHNIKSPTYNIFMTDIVDGLQSQILIKLCHSVGMNGEILLSLRDYLSKLESKLESEKPWHLNTEQLNETNKSNPSTPTPQLKPMSSMGHLDLNPIVEEQEDDMIDIKDVMSASNSADKPDDDIKQNADNESSEKQSVRTAMINLSKKAHEDEEDEQEDGMVLVNGNKDEFGDDDAAGWDEDDEENRFNEVDEKKLKKMQETQALLDEVKTWNEFVPLIGVTCYYHSLWVLMQSSDGTENGGQRFRTHSKYFWKCVSLLMEQLTTLPAGVEFGEFLLNTTIGKMSNKDLKVESKQDLQRLLNTAQFHEQGLWALVQFLTSQLKGISDRAVHQKLWQFIVHIINAADLKTRFQCIVSTALQCPIPVVQSLMFTELKNQIFNNWNVDLGEEKGQETDGNNLIADENQNDEEMMEMQHDTLNPFCSRQVVMVLVQRLGKELQNISVQNIYQELDSLNACLNLCRFILGKDKDTNYTQIYDADCPLRQVLQKLYAEMTRVSQENANENAAKNKNKEQGKIVSPTSAVVGGELEDFQKQMMKNQFLVSLDLVKRILEMYNK